MTPDKGPAVAGHQPEDVTQPEAFVPRLGLPAWIYDLIVLGCLAGLGIAFIIGGLGLKDDPGRMIDPGTVPAIAGGLLFVTSVIGAVMAVRNRGLSEVEVVRPFHVLLAMVLLLIFPSAIDSFGYYTTAVVWVPAFAWAAGARQWSFHLIVLVVVLALARFVFEMILGTPLP